MLNQIHHSDNLQILRQLPDKSVDLVVTSPPYKDCDGYDSVSIKYVFDECYRVLKDDSLFFLNFGHLAEDKFRPFQVCSYATLCGFKLNETIIWVKNHYRPIQGKKRLNNLSEFIFLLYKGEMPDLDRLAVGVPYADKSNVKRFAGGRDLKCGGNVWNIPYDTVQSKEEKLHNDRFPLELPLKCIKLAGLKVGSVVLDPYSGSGTTAVAAKSLGFSYIGMERNEDHVKTSLKRLDGLTNPV